MSVTPTLRVRNRKRLRAFCPAGITDLEDFILIEILGLHETWQGQATEEDV